jgi:hypothetical protein
LLTRRVSLYQPPMEPTSTALPSRRTFDLLFGLLRLRGATIVPLQRAARRLGIALARGARRTERLAEYAWWSGDAAGAIKHWRMLEQAQPTRAAWPLKIAQALSEGGAMDLAERTLLDARARGIENEQVGTNLLRYGRMVRRSNAALDEAEAIVADPGASPTRVFFAAFYLMAHNRLETARAGFTRGLSDKDYGPQARGQLAATGLLLENRAKGGADVAGWVSPAESSVLIRAPSSDTLVVGFTLPLGTLSMPMNAVQAMLSSKGVNALYLYDSHQLFHLKGTDRFGPGYQAMLDGIRALAAELGTRKLITVGASATGITALRTAIDLDADGALLFSGQSLMPADANAINARSAYTIERLRANVLPMMQNMRPLLEAKKPPVRVAFYYSALNRRDRMHAANLAGVPGVTLHPVAGHSRHDCLAEMAARGYRDLLDGFSAKAVS